MILQVIRPVQPSPSSAVSSFTERLGPTAGEDKKEGEQN